MKWDDQKDGVQLVEAGFWPDPRFTNEQRLILAIIDRAMQDAYATKTTGMNSARVYPHLLARLRQDALSWLVDTAEHPLSFRWCCDMLNMPARVMTTQYKKHVD